MASLDVWILDYGAGNVRSIRNAITSLGFRIHDVQTPADLDAATRVGARQMSQFVHFHRT